MLETLNHEWGRVEMGIKGVFLNFFLNLKAKLYKKQFKVLKRQYSPFLFVCLLLHLILTHNSDTYIYAKEI